MPRPSGGSGSLAFSASTDFAAALGVTLAAFFDGRGPSRGHLREVAETVDKEVNASNRVVSTNWLSCMETFKRTVGEATRRQVDGENVVCLGRPL